MSNFNQTQTFTTVDCYKCGVTFAMTADMDRRRRNDHEKFYCPNGHGQAYLGKTEAQKLREELDAQTRRLENARQNVERVRHERDAVAKAHRKMRARVMNGVCPCCNRSFANLRQHMQGEHPEFGKPQTVRALREAFGLTQAQVADEAGVKMPYVSLYERGKPVPVDARDNLEWWLDQHGGRA